jgi:hypothetical protein
VKTLRPRRYRKLAASVATLALLIIACNDDGPTGPEGSLGVETAVVINSIDLSLTVFPVDSPQNRRAIGIAQAGSPVSVAVRKSIAVVPLGLLSAAAIVDLNSDVVTSVPLPANSGATGAAFFDDATVYVGNPGRNSVSKIDVTSGTADAEIEVGVFPQAIIASRFWVFVLNGELDENYQPARAGTITVIDPKGDTVRAIITLSGYNPSAAAFGPDGRLYVINSGSFGQGNGSLSVVDPVTLMEVEHDTGFGEFPGDIAVDESGLVYASSFAYGITVWNPSEGGFRFSPSNPLILGGHAISSGIGFDSEGALYSLIPGDCIAPSVAVRTDEDESTREIPVGVCPYDVAFTQVSDT